MSAPRRTNDTVARLVSRMMADYNVQIKIITDEQQRRKLSEYVDGLKTAYDLLTDRCFFDDIWNIYMNERYE